MLSLVGADAKSQLKSGYSQPPRDEVTAAA